MSEHPIVAGYRGLDSADAVQLGALFAAALREPLVLASAYRYDPVALSARAGPETDNDRRAAAAETALRRAYAFIPPGIDVRERVVPSSGVAGALVELAREVDACVLTLGRDTQARVTRSLIPQAPCPIAVAPLSVPLPPAGGLTRIGVAFDGSTTACSALVAASHLARAVVARLVLLAAGPRTDEAETVLEVARLSLDRNVESFEMHALVGDPSTTLAHASDDLDLLVCGSRGHGRLLAAVLGSVSAHLVGHAHCAVLVVPPVVGRSPDRPLGLASAASNV